jgi:hypothetical protein
MTTKEWARATASCWSDCKSKMQGSLHCAADDETVRCFGRDDDFFLRLKVGQTMMTTDSSAALRNDKQKSVEE